MTSSAGSPRDAAAERRRSLAERVTVAPTAEGVAFVPDRILFRGQEAERRVKRLTSFKELPGFDLRSRSDGAHWRRGEVADPLAMVELLRADGLEAQPEHVFFAHGCDPCGAAVHPSVAYRSLEPAPYKANPYKGNPYKGNPYKGNPYKGNDVTSSAVPAAGRAFPPRSLAGPGHPRITVLDTGLAGVDTGPGPTAGVNQLPPLLPPSRITGTLDRPDADIAVGGGRVYAADGWLDPVAGHGTFIAGLIEQLAPGCVIRVENVIGPLGDAREGDVYAKILAEAMKPSSTRPHILSMSFGGRILQSAPALRGALALASTAGIVLVASAGNDASPLPQYPAAFDQVVGVGAVGPDGPAPWTNYGEWVDACAPGVDLVSAFFAAFNGYEPLINATDLDQFAGWATWSGTSFSTPIVVAALAREMVLGRCTAAVAVDRVVRAPYLLRIPCLGTVVNV